MGLAAVVGFCSHNRVDMVWVGMACGGHGMPWGAAEMGSVGGSTRAVWYEQPCGATPVVWGCDLHTGVRVRAMHARMRGCASAGEVRVQEGCKCRGG